MTVALDIPGTWNARDAATLIGLTPGVLLRSAALVNLTDAGRAELTALGVTDVIDLRSERDVAEQGADAITEPITPHALPILPASLLPPLTPENMSVYLDHFREPGFGERLMEFVYVDIVTDPAWVAQLGRALTIIADAEGATLVHCVSGKDRTGVLVALAASIAGADSEAIDADFLYSRHAVKQQTVVVPPGFSAEDLSLLAPLLGVQIGALNAARAAIEEHHGGLQGFLTAAGVEEATVAKLRARLAPPDLTPPASSVGRPSG